MFIPQHHALAIGLKLVIPFLDCSVILSSQPAFLRAERTTGSDRSRQARTLGAKPLTFLPAHLRKQLVANVVTLDTAGGLNGLSLGLGLLRPAGGKKFCQLLFGNVVLQGLNASGNQQI